MSDIRQMTDRGRTVKLVLCDILEGKRAIMEMNKKGGTQSSQVRYRGLDCGFTVLFLRIFVRYVSGIRSLWILN